MSNHIARAKVELAKQALLKNPNLTAAQFQRDNEIGRSTAQLAMSTARAELKQSHPDLREKSKELQLRQQQEALNALDRQISRVEDLPPVLNALRKDTFELNDDGEVIGIKEMIKGYNKEGDPIYLTPASIVNEYLQSEKLVIEQERTVTGITAAEKQASAREGRTEIALQLPISPEQIKLIKPIDD